MGNRSRYRDHTRQPNTTPGGLAVPEHVAVSELQQTQQRIQLQDKLNTLSMAVFTQTIAGVFINRTAALGAGEEFVGISEADRLAYAAASMDAAISFASKAWGVRAVRQELVDLPRSAEEPF